MTEDSRDSAPPQRDDTDDHDLLTYGEAGVRLYEEVRAQRTLVEALELSGPSDELAEARRRLEMLEAAFERNTRQPINDDNFEAFFGYKGTARRNT